MAQTANLSEHEAYILAYMKRWTAFLRAERESLKEQLSEKTISQRTFDAIDHGFNLMYLEALEVIGEIQNSPSNS
jgi:predicted peroxiredoxin